MPTESPRRPRPATGRQDRHAPAAPERDADRSLPPADPPPLGPARTPSTSTPRDLPPRRKRLPVPLIAAAIAFIIVALGLLMVALSGDGPAPPAP